MKKLFLIIVIAIFGVTAVGAFPAQVTYAYAEDDKNKDNDKKKDPAGPAVVKDKGKDKGGSQGSKDSRKDPKKDKKPD